MRLAALAACAVLVFGAGAVEAGTFSCEEINGVGDCGQPVQQRNQQGGTGTQTNSVTVNQSTGSSMSTGSSVTVTDVNGVCEIVVNGHPPQPC